MKRIIAAAVLAALAASACAQLPESVRGPFAARGATTKSDASPQAVETSPYPYNSPYGN